MAKQTTYVFGIGDVDSGNDVYFSWLIDAASEEEAVRRSEEAMAESADGGGEPLYVETNGSPTPHSDEDREKVHAGVLRVNPDRITAANIVESYEAYDHAGHPSQGGGA